MDRANHYESAFAAYLRANQLCHISVNETRRSHVAGVPTKSLDCILHAKDGAKYLVDVKGRRFPLGPPEKPRRTWECWSTLADIDGMQQWGQEFGPGYEPIFVFMYQLLPNAGDLTDSPDVWHWQDRRYLLHAVELEQYRRWMRPRSPKWGTVTLPAAVRKQILRPLRKFLFEPFSPEFLVEKSCLD